jgi:mono/diheme cytochrome c family protein
VEFAAFGLKGGFKMKLLSLALALVLTGCSGEHEKPNWTYMPNMAYSPANKAQEPQEGNGNQMRSPVQGTLAQGFEVYRFKDNPEGAGKELKNPLQRTKLVLIRGQELFNIYCSVCHGKSGEGDGSVVPKFPRPPTLQSEKVRDYPDGRIFHIITAGQNLMPSYATQVEPKDRWAIVHYIRALYRSKHPTPEDLKAAENW